MQNSDIASLVKSILAVIALSTAIGQYRNLEHWAELQALSAFSNEEPLPYFFPKHGKRTSRQSRKKEGYYAPRAR